MGAASSGMPEERPDRIWIWLLGLAMLASGVLLMVMRSQIGFFLDDWDLVIYRGTPTDWLLPHNEHIVVLPAAIYKLSLAIFGMTAIPLHLVAVALFLTSVAALFFWLRPLTGAPSAFFGCLVVLFLGAATEDLVWAFQMGFFGSVAAGLGALLQLRRGARTGDRWACLLLVVSVLFSSLGIPFTLGAAVLILFGESLHPDWRRLPGRAWIFLVPALLYAGWWLGWGHLAPNALGTANLRQDPVYLLSGLGYSALVLTGTFKVGQVSMDDGWALPGLILALILGLVLFIRRRIPVELLVAATIALGFWALSGLNYIPGREFFNSRYQYPGAVILLMLLGGAFAGSRPGPRTLAVIAAVCAVSLVVNLQTLNDLFRGTYRPYAQRNHLALAGLDLASRTVPDGYAVAMTDDGQALVDAGSYLEAAEKYGKAGLPADEIGGLPVDQRIRLDQILVGALPVRLLPAGNLAADRDLCRTVTADPAASGNLEVGSSLMLIRSRRQVTIKLGRFGPGTGALAWFAPGGRAVGYRIPRDHSERPWRIGFKGRGPVTVCPASPSK